MNHSGTISSNETWSPGDNPHVITGNITINSGAIVTVEAGCEIYFDGFYYIYASSGNFNVEGSEGNEVLITSNASAPSAGDWNYLKDNANSTSHLRYAIIEYLADADWIGGIRDFGEITHCLFRHTDRYCIALRGNNNQTIEYNIFYDVEHPIWGFAGSPTFSDTISIKYNLFYDLPSNQNAIDIGDDLDGTINIINNTIIGGGTATGINTNGLGGSGTIRMHNNIIYGWWRGINKSASCTFDNDYNDFYNNTTDINGTTKGTHSITSDPEFIDFDNDDFTIGMSSPCATAGNPTYEEYIGYAEPFGVRESDTLTFSDDIDLNLSLEKIELLDTLNLAENLAIAIHQKQYLSDILNLNDEIEVVDIMAEHVSDILNLNDEIYLNVPQLNKKLSDTLNLSDEFFSDLFTVSRNHFDNQFGMLMGGDKNLLNDIRTRALNQSNFTNDVRFILSFQQPGDTGFQSLGKTYIKVYIDSVEQTDIDIDSITINQNLNSAHNASFVLGRPYDTESKPAIDSSIEIKYHIWTLYKGYITEINPADRPDSIKVDCQDEYWKRNRTKMYFNVGHRPSDETELYYSYISSGLSACGASFGIGGFIPQVMNLFGTGESDAISQLVENSGNYGWFYHVDKVSGTLSKKLQISGAGDVINLERQKLETNLGLYQVLSHNIRESISNIVNKYRVQMGNITIRRFNSYGGTKEYSGYEYEYFITNAIPSWNSVYESLAKDADNGQDIFHHTVANNNIYKDVFTKYNLPGLESDLEEWTDEFPPTIDVLIPFGWWQCSLGTTGRLTEGFTIDYAEKTVTFNEPIYLYQTDENNELTELRRPQITLHLWKKKYYSRTDDPSDDPTSDISNPLMFFTSKMGSYSDTIMENLSLEGLGIQIGGWYQSGETESGRPIYTYVPSWNDTAFAQDYANWQLSKHCDKEYKGSIDLTIDAMCFYDIDLSNRIMINNVLDTNLNIESISYNIGSWKATINLTNGRSYSRSVSIPSHGE